MREVNKFDAARILLSGGVVKTCGGYNLHRLDEEKFLSKWVTEWVDMGPYTQWFESIWDFGGFIDRGGPFFADEACNG